MTGNDFIGMCFPAVDDGSANESPRYALTYRTKQIIWLEAEEKQTDSERLNYWDMILRYVKENKQLFWPIDMGSWDPIPDDDVAPEDRPLSVDWLISDIEDEIRDFELLIAAKVESAETDEEIPGNNWQSSVVAHLFSGSAVKAMPGTHAREEDADAPDWPALVESRENSDWEPLLQFLAEAMNEKPNATRTKLAIHFGIVCDRHPEAQVYCHNKRIDPSAINLDSLGKLRKKAASFLERMEANRLKSDG